MTKTPSKRTQNSKASCKLYTLYFLFLAGPVLEEDPTEVPVFPTVALLKLKETIDFQTYPHIRPICLPPPLEKSHHQNSVGGQVKKTSRRRGMWKVNYERCYVSGWGLQSLEPVRSLHILFLTSFSHDQY